MSMKHLGDTFDIHGGGQDLIFPHHENEIAQSCAATGKEFARYWVHNGFVQINQEKMSKSLGNFFTIREIFEQSGYRNQVTAESLRYLLLTTHYRSPLDFSADGLWEAKRALTRFYGLFQRLEEPSRRTTSGAGWVRNLMERFGDRFYQVVDWVTSFVRRSRVKDLIEKLDNGFRQALDDDFNTPAAIAQFQNLQGELNRLLETGLSRYECKKAREAFRKLGKELGLFQLAFRDWDFMDLYPPTGLMDQGTQSSFPPQVKKWHPGYSGEITQPITLTDKEIQEKVAERNEARRRKDFMRADAIRNELASFGVILEDRPDGTTRWKR